MSISTNISSVNLQSCIYNASGCNCTTLEQLDSLYKSEAGAIISKSGTVNSRPGNPEPRLSLVEHGSINSMGVPNLGYKFYLNYSKNIKDKPYIQSIIPFNINDLEIMLTDINKNSNYPYLVEVNLSCPNIVNKSIVAYDYESFNKYLDKINNINTSNLIIGLKLPPYFEFCQFEQIANIIKKYTSKIKFLTCINSMVNGLIIDSEKEETLIYPKEGYGGIGGMYAKPFALSNVNKFYKLLGDEIDIIGCGGVSSGQDVFDHILCGASAVQVGTQLVKEGPTCFERIEKELIDIMERKGYSKISDFKGRLNVKHV
jgi:dihydroorotate dehydrogenase (fumarate)